MKLELERGGGLVTQWIKFKETTQMPPVIFWDLFARSFKLFTRAHDGKTRIKNFRCALHARWWGEKDFRDYVEMLKRSTPRTLIKWARAYRRKKLVLLAFAEKAVKQARKKRLTNKELTRLFLKLADLSARCYNYGYDYFVLNSFYSDRVNALVSKHAANLQEFNYWLSRVTGLNKPTDLLKSQKELGELALHVKKTGFDARAKKMIKLYAKRYGYLATFVFLGEPLDESRVRERVKTLARKSETRIIKETIAGFQQVRENRLKTREFEKKFELNAEERSVIRVFKEYAFTSMWANELYHRIPFILKPVMLEASERIGLPYEKLVYLTVNEITNALKHGLTKKLARTADERAKDYALIYVNGKTRVLSGQRLKKYLEPELKKQGELASINELQGQPAFIGRAKGRVKVIRNLEDIKSFQRGRILVTTSTAPTHVPAMEKAAAIVTDEGGLLSHAAIVARELKKPCIIGTKHATKTLKDGDLVEVDASKSTGFIKILERK